MVFLVFLQVFKGPPPKFFLVSVLLSTNFERIYFQEYEALLVVYLKKNGFCTKAVYKKTIFY